MKELIKIGTITKPQGLKGQFRFKPSISNFSELKNISEVFINGKHYEVQQIVLRNVFVIIKVQGIDTIEQAENLRNIDIFCEKDLEKLDENEYLITDLINANAYTEKNIFLGKVKSIENFGSADVFTLEINELEIMFPNCREVIIKFDKAKKVLILNEKILNEIKI